ncbi:MAG: hypothetical protein CW345_05575 [Firmicutes bacterium]|nr:hypothetical protein [Bacillota bacterium]MBO2521258.1 hypothetical protein [Bacillota bacterium]
MRYSADLKVTLVLAVLAFGGLLFLAFAAVSSYWVTHDLSEQFRRRGEVLAENLAAEAAASLAIDNVFERRLRLLLLTSRATIDDVAYAQVVQGGLVISESIQPGGLELPVILNPPARLTVSRWQHQHTEYLDFIRPLPPGAGSGYIRVGLSLESVQRRTRQVLRVIGGLSVLFTGLAVVGVFGLYSIILRPLDRLMESIRQVSQGAFPVSADIRGCREFEEISAAFNHMAREINRRTEALHQRNAELQQANRAKAEFLAMVGHELKAPLHSIRGYCQLLLEEAEGPLTPAQRTDLQAMLAAANHLLALIQNILRFIERGADSVHLSQVDLGALLQHAADYVRPMAQAKGIRVVVSAPGLPRVLVDETKVRQVLINLLHNAVKYTREGCVEVSAWCAEDGTYVRVRDTGPGIPPEEQQRIFEPFVRIERGESKEARGMGLGLAVVQRYVEAHGGWVKLSSAQGRGSTFTLFLPRQEARAPIREHRQGASTGGRRPAGTVLPQAVPAGPGTATDSEEGSGLAPANELAPAKEEIA